MYCYRGLCVTDKGDALPGWQVECVQNDNLTMPVTIYADENLTPISSISGINNRALVDSAGNFFFFVEEGLYGLRFYDSAGVFQRSERFYSMYGEGTFTEALSDAEAFAAAADASASAAAASAAEALRQAERAAAWAEGTLPGGAGTKSAKEWAGEAAVSASASAASANYYSTIAAGIAGTSVGGAFSSAEGGPLKLYERTATSPFYTEIGELDGELRADLASTATGKGDALIGSDDGASGSQWSTVKGFITYLRSSAGAAIIGFVQAGVGAVSRFIRDKLRERITPEDFGAVGDGVADDTAKLKAAITAAGVNGTLFLKPGATYLISSGLTSLAGQRIVGYGATIKRRNQIVTTTTTAMTSGSTTVVTLTSATGFAVGMQVAFAQVSVARSALVYGSTLSGVRTITAINGNQITLNSAIDINVSIGGTCFLTFTSLSLAEGATMEGITFDGNRSNWSYSRWEVTVEAGAPSVSNNQSFLNCKFNNVPGEAILPYGDNLIITGNRFNTIGGNAIHLSGVVGAIISGNHGTNGNIDTAVGHADGFVSFSNGNERILVTENEADTFIAGVGALNATDAHITITDNDFKTMYCFGIEGGSSLTNLVVANNRIDGVASDTSKKTGIPYYGGIVFIGLSGADYLFQGNHVRNVSGSNQALAIGQTSTSTDLRIVDNDLTGNVVLAGSYDEQFVGNTVVGRVQIAGAVTRLKVNRNNVRSSGVTCIATTATAAYAELEIEDNTVIGGVNGIDLTASATSYSGVSVSRNKMFDQSNRSINFANSAATIDGLVIDGNKIRVGANAGSSFIGIYNYNDKVSILRNTLTNAVGAGSRIGIYAAGPTTAEMILADNIVRDAWSHTMYLTASAGAYVRGNMLKTKAATNPTGNNVSGEIVF